VTPHLYLVLDVWSRRIVGWCIAERGSAEIAAELITHACREGNFDPKGLVLQSLRSRTGDLVSTPAPV